MTSKHDPLDLTTLEAVHRLLTETEFATAADLAERVGPTLPRSDAGAAAPAEPAGIAVEGGAALPRRR